MKKEYKYEGNCTEIQARAIIHFLNEDRLMVKSIHIGPKEELNVDGLCDKSDLDRLDEAKDSLENYLEKVKSLYSKAIELKIMPLTRIEWSECGSKIRNERFFYMDDDRILKIYCELTNLSKLLSGWRVGAIIGRDLESKEDIIKTKVMMAALPEGYSFAYFRILQNPWIRTADHYADYLECSAELTYYGGKITIISEDKILFDLKKKLPGLSLEEKIENLP